MKYLNINSILITEAKINPEMLTSLIKLIIDGKINGKQGKEILEKMMDSGKDANTLVNELGMTQISNQEEIKKIVLEVLDENVNIVEDFKNGKNVFGYIVGLVMKKTNGKANPVITSNVLKEELEKLTK